MIDETGTEIIWDTVPQKSSENLSTLSEGLDWLLLGKMEELIYSQALKDWTPPKGFWELPVYKQRPILEKALRENPTN
jgi:hypothetical protein